MAVDPATSGYWLITPNGNVYNFNAPWYGSKADTALPAPIVGITAAPSGGYWLVTSKGNVYNFNAPWYGSQAGTSTGIEPQDTPTGNVVGGGDFADLDAFVERTADERLADYLELLLIPSIGTLSENDPDTRATAHFVRDEKEVYRVVAYMVTDLLNKQRYDSKVTH